MMTINGLKGLINGNGNNTDRMGRILEDVRTTSPSNMKEETDTEKAVMIEEAHDRALLEFKGYLSALCDTEMISAKQYKRLLLEAENI